MFASVLPHPQAPLRAGKRAGKQGARTPRALRLNQSHKSTHTALKQGATPGDEAAICDSQVCYQCGAFIELSTQREMS